MGGKSPEYEVSLITGQEVVKHLNPDKYEVFPIVVSKDGQNWQLKNKEKFLTSNQNIFSAKDLIPTLKVIDQKTIPEQADLVFIAMHGPFGEDGTIQGMLELIGVPYTGAGVLASALGMNKVMFKKIMISENILVAESIIIIDRNDNPEKVCENLSLPIVVKPSSQGSSVGVSLVRKKEELKKALKTAFNFGPLVLIEKYLPGTEISCGVLGNKNPFALPVVEIVSKNDFFDYEAKYNEKMADEIIPAKISEKLTKEAQKIAVKVYKAIGCRGFGRVDMIISKGRIYVLEINTIPGLTPASLLPKEAVCAGISYEVLLEKIITYALKTE